jgi:hypothetical protein
MRLLLLLLVWVFVANAQTNPSKIEYSIIQNVYPRGQVLEQTCWAASLEMLENAFGKKSTFQIDQINASYHGTRFTYNNFQRNNAIQVTGKTINELYNLINSLGYACDTSSLISWQAIKNNFRGPNPSPIIILKEYEDKMAHITTVIGYTEIELQPNISSKTLLINDPWVKNLDTTGIQYGLNFDFFEQNKAAALEQKIFYRFRKNTNTSLVSSTNLRINAIDSSSFKFNQSNTSFRAEKDFCKSKKETSLDFATKNIQTLNVNSAEVNKVLNLRSRTTLSPPVSVVDLDTTAFNSSSVFQRQLANGKEHFYFSAVEGNADTSYVYITTKDEREIIKKYTVMTERIEPYRNSVIKVLKTVEKNVNQQSTSTAANAPSTNTTSNLMASSFKMPTIALPKFGFDFNKVYLLKTFSKKPDFMLIPKSNSNNLSFILIDLFDQLKEKNGTPILPKIKGFELPILNKPFNFSVYDFGINDLSKLKAFWDKK